MTRQCSQQAALPSLKTRRVSFLRDRGYELSQGENRSPRGIRWEDFKMRTHFSPRVVSVAAVQDRLTRSSDNDIDCIIANKRNNPNKQSRRNFVFFGFSKIKSQNDFDNFQMTKIANNRFYIWLRHYHRLLVTVTLKLVLCVLNKRVAERCSHLNCEYISLMPVRLKKTTGLECIDPKTLTGQRYQIP